MGEPNIHPSEGTSISVHPHRGADSPARGRAAGRAADAVCIVGKKTTIQCFSAIGPKLPLSDEGG